MSKFDEMCKTYEDARKNWDGYYQRGLKQVSTLTTGFIKYCEIPQGSFSFVPPEGTEAKKHYTPPDAIKIEDDGYWHVGWRIKIPHAVLVRVIFKEVESDKISVRCGWEKQDRILDLKDEGHCHVFYEVIVQRIKDFYKQSAEDLGKAGRSDKMGFQVL